MICISQVARVSRSSLFSLQASDWGQPGQAFYLGTIRKDPVRAGSEGSMVAGSTWNVGKASDVSAVARVSLLH